MTSSFEHELSPKDCAKHLAYITLVQVQYYLKKYWWVNWVLERINKEETERGHTAKRTEAGVQLGPWSHSGHLKLWANFLFGKLQYQAFIKIVPAS